MSFPSSALSERLRRRRCWAGLLALAALAGSAAPALAQTEIWSATLTVQNSSGFLGCFDSGRGIQCSDTSVLTDDDFTYGTTDYTIPRLFVDRARTLFLGLNPSHGPTTGALELVVNGRRFALARGSTGGDRTLKLWKDSGLRWSEDDTVQVRLVTAAAPGAPTSLTATASGTAQVDLQWTTPSSNGGASIRAYWIEWSADGNAPWNELDKTEDSRTSYSNTGLLSATTRHYRVSAFNTADTGDPSNVAFATTDDGAPSAPTSLTATAGGATRIDLQWTVPLSNGGVSISGYGIEWSADGNAPWADLVASTGSANTSYSDTSLQPATARHYRVSAINSLDTGDPSNVAFATTDAAAPGAPTSLTATASGATLIDLQWTAPSSNGGASISGYGIEWSADGNAPWAELVANTGNVNTSYSDTSLQPVTTRHYRVSAINTAGTGDSSNVALATTDAAAPGAPTSLTATASGATRIDLQWTAPSSNGGASISGYGIEWSADGNAPWAELVANTGNVNTSYSDTSLQPVTTRHYRVSAINTAGTGDSSNVASATTQEPPPNPPSPGGGGGGGPPEPEPEPEPEPGPLKASFTVDVDCSDDLCRALTGNAVRFVDTSTGAVRRRLWSFGDDRSATSTTASRAWGEPGFYTVTLTVGDGSEESTASLTFLVEAASPAGTCAADAHTRCLQDSRYAVTVGWRTADGGSGKGSVVDAGTNDSGLFRFFDADNWEVLIKVLDGCALNEHVWVFGASTTDLGYVIRVTDTVTGDVKEYGNDPGMPAPAITDGRAFPACAR